MSKLGIFSWFSYPLPIQTRLEMIKEAGFDATSLWWASEDREIQPDLARHIGLEIDNIHAPFPNANSLWCDGIDGDSYLDLLITCVDDCAQHQIDTVVIHPTGFRDEPEVTQIGVDRVRRLVDAAEKKGVNLAFENLHCLDHLDYILRKIPSERVGFCYDSGHENCYHSDADCLSLYGDKMIAIHLDDNFGDADTHLLPFDGNAKWEKVKSSIKSSRELKYLTLEVDFNVKSEYSQLYRDMSALDYLRRAYEKAKQFNF